MSVRPTAETPAGSLSRISTAVDRCDLPAINPTRPARTMADGVTQPSDCGHNGFRFLSSTHDDSPHESSQPPGITPRNWIHMPLSQRPLTAAISLEVPRTPLKACPPLRRHKRCPEERGRTMCGHQVDHGYVSSAPGKSTATTKTEVTREA